MTRRSHSSALLLIIVACVALLDLVVCHPSYLENSAGFLFDTRHTQFSLPLHISVGLLGFHRDGAHSVEMVADELRAQMEDALPVHVPANVQREEEENIQYHLTYSATHLRSELLTRVETALRENMKLIGQTADGISIFDIEVSHIASVLDELYRTEFTDRPLTEEETTQTIGAQDSIANRQTSEEKHLPMPPLAMIVINPDKIRMNPLKTKPYIYRYRYDGSAPTQQFIAAKRYLLIDLSAGPITYGVSDSGDGTVTLGTVPIIDIKPIDPSSTASASTSTGTGVSSNAVTTKFVSELATFLLTGVRHVFISDTRWATMRYAEKVIMPLIVFKNHRRFNPIRKEKKDQQSSSSSSSPLLSEFEIDLAKVRAESSKLLLPEQELLFVHGTHYLHEHQHISTAVFKALRQDSLAATRTNAGLSSTQITRTYLDSKILLREFEHAADDIVAGLMLEEETPILPTTVLPTTASKPTSKGHQILPIFVLSLLGLPPNTLFDGKHLSVASSRCVLVLQTGNAPIPVPFFTDGHLITLNPRDVTRHIIGGVTTALGGVVEPYLHYDTNLQTLRPNYVWSIGALPWGHFANSTSLSILFADAAIRNSIVTRVTSSIRAIHRSIEEMREFASKYTDANEELDTTSATAKSTPSSVTSSTFSFDRFGTGLAHEVGQRLSTQLVDIENQMLQLSNLIALQHWSRAHTLSGNIYTIARAYEKYVTMELIQTSQQLACCHKVYSLPPEHGWIYSTAIFLAMFMLAGFVYFILQWRLINSSNRTSFGGRMNSNPFGRTLGTSKVQRTW